ALSPAGATALNVPATLHASLMARLDRLGSAAKEVAQVGAALGREFSYELLAAVAQRNAAESRCRSGSARRRRSRIPPGRSTTGHLPLQARASPGRGLWHAAAWQAAGAARAGRTCVGGTVARDGRDTT